jgi:hypothetical protein
MVQIGDLVTCVVTSQTDGLNSADYTAQEVSQNLAAQGYPVLTASTSEGILNAIGSVGYGVPFQATMVIQSPAVFAQPTDLLSIVQNAFYQVLGVYPTAASVPTVQTPGAAPQSTGLPSASPTDVGGAGSDTALGNSFTNFLNSLKSLGEGALALIVLLIFGLVFVVGYSPNTREVARAVA